MRSINVFLNTIVSIAAITVPTTYDYNPDHHNRKEFRVRGVNQFAQQPNYLNQHYVAELQPSNAPTNNAWLPKTTVKIITAGTRPRNYRNFPKRQAQKKGKKFFNHPLKTANSKEVFQNSYNSVPYITYNKQSNQDFFINPLNLDLYKAYPQISKPLGSQNVPQPSQAVQYRHSIQPKHNSPDFTNFDQTFNLPISQYPATPFPTKFPLTYTESPFLPIIPEHAVNSYESIKNNNIQSNPIQDLEQLDNASSQQNVASEFNKPQYYSNTQGIAPDSNKPQYHSSNPNKQAVTPESNKPQFYDNHLDKHYSDDIGHEPSDNEEDPKFEREETEKIPVSSHEVPADIPTRPIYPGEGVWAKPGLKHRPFISKQKYEELKNDEEKPDGFDTFVEGKELFVSNKNNLGEDFEKFPENHKLGNGVIVKEDSEYKDTIEPSKTDINEESSEESEEFVPTRLYAQVRSTEDKQYLPEEDDGRLREAIKESKVHTVYTEEGYEDSAYDHAGHEKEAENDEGFEDIERKKSQQKEKKAPHIKYNLHVPKYTKYGNGDGVISDEEIERIKQEQLGFADAEGAGTQFEELEKEDQSDDENSTDDYATTLKPMRQNNNFISTKETKTTTTKEKEDGNTETEISRKVKTIVNPVNSTKPQKYVKISPKVYKTIQRKPLNVSSVDDNFIPVEENSPVNFSGIFIEEIITTTDSPFTKLQPIQFDDFHDEIPITTLPTTAIPRPIKNKDIDTDALDDDTPFEDKRRFKRFTNDFNNLRLENAEFLPPISHELQKIGDNVENKYPYYHNYARERLNENSPLRYSENLNRIPRKTGKRMAFYEQAEKKLACPEVAASVSPVPERVLNKEKLDTGNHNEEADENSDEDSKTVELPSTPRLSGLGNHIDCLKMRYFGDNPLDSPLFEEETVGQPKPIFNDLKHVKLSVSKNKFDQIRINHEKKENNNSIMRSDASVKVNISKSTNNNNNQKQSASTPLSFNSISSLTTPEYSVNLKPKHIYHQIELLNYLPDNQTDVNYNNESTLKMEKLVEDSSDDISVDETGIRRIDRGNNPPFLIFDINKFLPKKANKSKLINETTSNATARQLKAIDEDDSINDTAELPEAEELRRRRKIRRKRPPFQIFDINKFLPTTSSPIEADTIIASTVLPKYKVLSEVFYKDDIKPNEQLHVFTDILNNIKNSSLEQKVDASIYSSVTESTLIVPDVDVHTSNKKNPNINYPDSYLQAYSDQEVDLNYYASLITTTPAPTTTRSHISRGSGKFPIRRTPNLKKDKEERLNLYLALLEAKKQRPQYVTTTTNDVGYTIPVTERDQENSEKITKVMGLVPPNTQRYKTIHHPKRDNSHHIGTPGTKIIRINKFYVIGLRPPPKQKVVLYSDFINNNAISNRNFRVRGKRSTSEASYASLSRNRGQQNVESDSSSVSDEEDEDYVPHRSKNYYYDEKTGKIIYKTTKKPEESLEEDVEYEEIIEQPPSTSKPKDLFFATATPPPEGKSYVDFIKKLKESAGYKLIPDPTTTEKPKETATVKSTTTENPGSESPPEFLGILAKLKQDSQYKLIEDKKKTKLKSTTVQVVEQNIDEVDDEETQEENIQNSPGGQTNKESFEKMGIFDVTEFIPKIKNYLPRTSYDATKYKTIARPTSKPKTTDVDESDEEDSVKELVITTQKPSLVTTEVAPINDSLNEATSTKKTEKVPIVQQRRRITTRTTNITPMEQTTTKSTHSRRRRPTTPISSVGTTHITTTPSPTSTETQSNHLDKLRRNYRRKPTRIRNEHTSPRNTDADDEDNIPKVLKRRSDPVETSTAKAYSNKFVEALKTYHKNKKRGESLKKVDSPSLTITSPKSVIDVTKDVEVVSDYDKSKRHGGNYRKLEDDDTFTPVDDNIDNEYEIIDEDAKTPEGEPLLINLLPKHDEDDQDDSKSEKTVLSKTLSTNIVSTTVKPKYISTPKGKIHNVQYKRRENSDKRNNFVTEPTLTRLTDIVPKPESFYKDPLLPVSVNMLIGTNNLSSDEITDILRSTESSDSSEISQKTIREVSTQRPFFIRDPSKRLYYYAPI